MGMAAADKYKMFFHFFLWERVGNKKESRTLRGGFLNIKERPVKRTGQMM
jgi:hypothetical protein